MTSCNRCDEATELVPYTAWEENVENCVGFQEKREDSQYKNHTHRSGVFRAVLRKQSSPREGNTFIRWNLPFVPFLTHSILKFEHLSQIIQLKYFILQTGKLRHREVSYSSDIASFMLHPSHLSCHTPIPILIRRPPKPRIDLRPSI